ncbi:MAG: autotransporter outer membrane beta-barrel domain-containing protein, partial [Xanthomonadaceae bacterium]|nr:autotransporter outer membrane beta-barrel domain-containing protein [Xanthomonadaceae bacterium]
KPGVSALAMQLETGFSFRIAQQWSVQPHASVLGVKSSQDGYTESGGGALSLQYQAIDQTSYLGNLGMRLGTSFKAGKALFEPYFDLTESATWGDRQPTTQVAFIGAPASLFQVRANKLPGTWLNAEVGFHMVFSKAIQLDVGYHGTLGGHLRNDYLNAGLSWRF